MEKTTKIRVGVIMGGQSDEHDVSIMSSVSVMTYLDSEKYEIVPIGISRKGHWISLAAPELHSPEGDYSEALIESAVSKGNEITTRQTIGNLCASVDVVFPVLHGPFGEDGTIQGLFEMLGIPYVGAGVEASAVCMDKGHTKRILRDGGVPVVPWVEFRKTSFEKNENIYLGQIEKMVYPLFVKPANLGSSVGISKVKNAEELKPAILKALEYDDKVLVEQGVSCRELECAVLGNDEARASCVGEIIPAHEFYDYEAKYYCDGESKMIVPAEAVSSDQVQQIREYALWAHELLGIEGLARIDSFLDKDSGQIYLNEINTMPGFTKYSMYPTLWAESGLGYSALLDRLIGHALGKN